MLNNLRIFWIVIFILISIQACSGIKVSQDYDQAYNFSGLKTFAWKPNKNNEYGLTDNQLVDERIRKAIVKNLKSKQFLPVETGKADFYISYHLTVEQKISTSNVSGGVSVGRSSRGRYGSVGMSTGSQVQAYNQGTLLVDITDIKTNKLIWRGISTQTVSEHSSPEKSTELINKTVDKIMLQFPPHKK
jgi:hypothetical protein